MTKKVKIIKSNFSSDLENSINDFMQQHQVIDIKLSISDKSFEKYIALIIYIQE